MGRDTLIKHNYRDRETRNEVARLLRTMAEEWHTGVGPAGQVIMRPIDRLRNQIKELQDVLE